jgi:hypothetical protein
MEHTYEIVLAVILLFPWSIVATMVAGTVWNKLRHGGRIRIAVRTGDRLSVFRQKSSRPPV